MSVNNGKKIEVDLIEYQGTAGFVESDGTASLAYVPTKAKRLQVGELIEADGRQWEIVRAEKSRYVRDFRVLTLKEAVDG